MKIEIKTPNGGMLFWDMPEWNSLKVKERELILKEIMAPNYASIPWRIFSQ